MKALLAVTLMLAAAAARAEPLESGIYYAQSDPAAFKAEVSVSFVLLQGSGWTRPQAERLFEQLARVFAQCRLRFADAHISELAPLRGSVEELARASPAERRPVFYLVGAI
jgi:3-methyladenine DNA glycosylase/8-oxoguanine DNA glycosylase